MVASEGYWYSAVRFTPVLTSAGLRLEDSAVIGTGADFRSKTLRRSPLEELAVIGTLL